MNTINPVTLPPDRMPEAEVSLRLAFYLLQRAAPDAIAKVAIDGAQVRIQQNQIFPISGFLEEASWQQVGQDGNNPWQGEYATGSHCLVIHARLGVGDVKVVGEATSLGF